MREFRDGWRVKAADKDLEKKLASTILHIFSDGRLSREEKISFDLVMARVSLLFFIERIFF